MKSILPTIWIRAIPTSNSWVIENGKETRFTNNIFFSPGHRDALLHTVFRNQSRSMITLQHILNMSNKNLVPTNLLEI